MGKNGRFCTIFSTRVGRNGHVIEKMVMWCHRRPGSKVYAILPPKHYYKLIKSRYA